jgi:hypothetical protein
MPAMRYALALLLAALACGCGNPTYLYEVQVKNGTKQPLSVGLVKAGRDAIERWAGPEHIAIGAPELMDRKWGFLVQPGFATALPPVEGPVGGRLRVYVGDRPIKELLTVNQGDPDRLDIVLTPGRSAYEVHTRTGKLQADTVPWTEPPPPPRKPGSQP